MTFHKHSKQYVIYYTIDSRQKAFYLGKDKKAAKNKYKKLEYEHSINRLSIENKYTGNILFGRVADMFLEDEDIKNNLHPITYNDYKECLSFIFSFFPNIKCNAFDLPTLKKLKRSLMTKKYQGTIRNKTGVSAERSKRYIGLIKRVLNWGIDNRILKREDIPFPGMKLIFMGEVFSKKRSNILSEKDIICLLEYPNNIPKYCNKKSRINILQTIEFCKHVLAGGHRPEEIPRLKKKDFNFDLNFYDLLDHKTSKTDSTPKTKPIGEIIKNIVKPKIANIGDDDYVYQDENGNPLNLRKISQCFSKIAKRLKLKITLKELRHSSATFLLLCGVPLPLVQQLLGHTDIKTTQRYIILANKELLDAVNTPKFVKLLSR